MFAVLAVLLFFAEHAVSQLPAHLLLENEVGKWPFYMRGKGKYRWVLTKRARENGLSYVGSNERLRAVLDRAMQGKPIKVAAIGGSITAGQGAVDAPNWPQYVLNYLQDELGEKVVSLANGAVGGTLSAYMSVCHNMHIPKDSDIIFVEYSVNDWHNPTPAFQNNVRRPFERLLRKLLNYPKRPAVVMMHQYIWYQAYPFEGSFWNNAEREFQEFAMYYQIPTVSIKACCYHLLANNTVGFDTRKQRYRKANDLKEIAYYYDAVHPDGRTGARVSAELVMHLMQRTMDDLTANKLSPEDGEVVAAPIPPPMIPNNRESVSDKCFIGNIFVGVVTNKDGFEWVNESKSMRPKFGFVATKPGSVLDMMVDTRATAASTAANQKDVLVEVAYLRSYEHMGQASITCVSGCKCQESTLEGHHEEQNSQLHLHHFYASQHSNCTIQVKVLDKTKSGEHKVKIAGIMVSEEEGQHDGIRNNLAVEYVHDISTRSKDNTFEVNNHA
uniref:SGNH hydrolase-type esterase domain-containing protein n=1 Tax=Chlamydomonas leiostraca TaxID=1034604 RepID=A0A7S0S1A6_9CHLO|mmetsp:Transcript_38139/g.96486  ORF Transcript_38139/g.96486 Transcript_38139/m.96486 type:complete len:499 (+) Transcript_38139:83-1579(+)